VSGDGVGEAGKAPLSSIFSAVSIISYLLKSDNREHLWAYSFRLQQAPGGTPRFSRVLVRHSRQPLQGPACDIQ